MNKEYYSDYYHYEREHWWFLIRSRIIEQVLIKHSSILNRPFKILNIGVATGATSQLLMKYGEVTSVEYDKDCCKFVEDILKTKVYNESIADLSFADGEFDLVCAFDVVEHVADHVKAVSEMERVCKKEGYLYVTVPAFMSLWSKHDVINHHERRYKLKTLRNLFEKRNGTEVYSSYFNSLLFLPIFIFRILNKLISTKSLEMEATSDFEAIKTDSAIGRIVNFLLGKVFSFELYFLRFIKFPFGVSIIYLWKKNEF
jgi:SAM-dependent methyltransferase